MKAVIRDKCELKDSFIDVLGTIPKMWKLCRIKNVANVQRGGSPRPIEDYLTSEEDGFNWIKIGDTVKGSKYIDDVKQRIRKEGLSKTRLVRKGTLLLTNSMSFGEAYILNLDGCIHDGWVALECNNNIRKEFLYYFLESELCKKQFNLQVAGGVVQNLNVDKIGSTYIFLPNDTEQQHIVAYLDDRCSKIDAIIAEAKASIEEYKELKQALIYEAVTKGLDKNVEMKDSGIEWIGQMPKNWSSVRFSKVNWIRARLGWKGLKADEYVDEGYPFLSAFNIQNNKLIWENTNHITIERYEESPEIKLQEKDILLVKDGAGIGKCARIDNLPLGESTVNSSLAVITSNKLMNYKYEYFYLLSPIFQNVITRLKNGMGVPHLTQEAMKEIVIPCPPIEEQTIIADYLDDKMSKIDLVIATKQSLIEDLEAYKKSLIYEVVTGKRKVVA